MEQEQKTLYKLIKISIGAFISLIVLAMWGCPQYKVYEQKLSGEAALAHAHAERQVQVQDAQAKLESAKSLALAEIERAKGVAESNRIIGDSLKNNDSYLRYLWIQGLQDKDNNTIYVPTEAGLPILEAGKRP